MGETPINWLGRIGDTVHRNVVSQQYNLITGKSDEPSQLLIAKAFSLKLPGHATSQYTGSDELGIQHGSTPSPSKTVLSPEKKRWDQSAVISQSIFLTADWMCETQIYWLGKIGDTVQLNVVF